MSRDRRDFLSTTMYVSVLLLIQGANQDTMEFSSNMLRILNKKRHLTMMAYKPNQCFVDKSHIECIVIYSQINKSLSFFFAPL